MPEQKVMQLRQMGQELLQQRYTAPGRLLAKFLGKLGSFRTACPKVLTLARGMMRCLQHLPTEWRIGKDEKSGDNCEFQWRDYSGTVCLSELAVAELRLWLACVWKLRATVLSSNIEVVTFTDACEKEGYGTVNTRPTSMGKHRAWEVQEVVGGAWEGRVEKHTCCFELRSIAGVCEQRAEERTGKRVYVCTDNVGAAFVMGKDCMRSAELHALALRVCGMTLQFDIALSAQNLAGDGIIVAGADGLSRMEDDLTAC